MKKKIFVVPTIIIKTEKKSYAILDTIVNGDSTIDLFPLVVSPNEKWVNFCESTA